MYYFSKFNPLFTFSSHFFESLLYFINDWVVRQRVEWFHTALLLGRHLSSALALSVSIMNNSFNKISKNKSSYVLIIVPLNGQWTRLVQSILSYVSTNIFLWTVTMFYSILLIRLFSYYIQILITVLVFSHFFFVFENYCYVWSTGVVVRNGNQFVETGQVIKAS